MENQSSTDLFHPDSANGKILQDAAKWARWLSIAGFLFIAGLLYLCARASYSWFTLPEKDKSVVELAQLTAVISLMAALFLYYPFRWLYRFGVHIAKAGRENKLSSLTVSLLALRAFFRYLAVWILLIIALYVVFVALTGIASMLNFGAH